MFCILYRWRLVPGMESSFRAAWRELSGDVSVQFGALSSRFHLAEDGIFVVYSSWPDRASWEAFWNAPVAALLQRMRDCVAERFEPIRMNLLETVP